MKREILHLNYPTSISWIDNMDSISSHYSVHCNFTYEQLAIPGGDRGPNYPNLPERQITDISCHFEVFWSRAPLSLPSSFSLRPCSLLFASLVTLSFNKHSDPWPGGAGREKVLGIRRHNPPWFRYDFCLPVETLLALSTASICDFSCCGFSHSWIFERHLCSCQKTATNTKSPAFPALPLFHFSSRLRFVRKTWNSFNAIFMIRCLEETAAVWLLFTSAGVPEARSEEIALNWQKI